MPIPFNIPLVIGDEISYITEALSSHIICGDGRFTELCSKELENLTSVSRALLTTSCTHATEMAAILSNIDKGDEVIMPSYTFVSTANAFVIRGATPVFIDIHPNTMNINENLIEDAITPRTKAITVVHYAGVSCEMESIMDIANRHNLMVIEDAAQAIGSTYNGKACGSFGDYGCYSFHETKNITMGEGGALLIRDRSNAERAEIIREKGTNRAQFHRGEVNKYTWLDIGSSYLPSELNTAYLYAQLLRLDEITNYRLHLWDLYHQSLTDLASEGFIELPFVPDKCKHNGHIYYIKCKDINERQNLINHLNSIGVNSVFHYIPLHSSPAGSKFGRFHGNDVYTTRESERILRLPMYYGLSDEDCLKVCEAIEDFYSSSK